MLQAEGQLLARIGNHPHVITLFQSLTLDDDRPALVLDRTTGSLAERLALGERLPLEQAVAIGVKIAGALETSHSAEVLHCDVRPGTILLTEFGEPVLAAFDESVSTRPGAPALPRPHHHRTHRARAARGRRSEPEHRRLRAGRDAVRAHCRPRRVPGSTPGSLRPPSSCAY